MDITNFAIWKFRNVEGKLKNVRCIDFDTTRFQPENQLSGEWYQLDYDYKNERVKISKYDFFLDEVTEIETVPFDDIVKLLKKYQLYKIAPSNERHSCSFGKDEFAQ